MDDEIKEKIDTIFRNNPVDIPEQPISLEDKRKEQDYINLVKGEGEYARGEYINRYPENLSPIAGLQHPSHASMYWEPMKYETRLKCLTMAYETFWKLDFPEWSKKTADEQDQAIQGMFDLADMHWKWLVKE